MKQSLALLFPLFFLCISCASKFGITKAQAFTRENVTGTIQVDDNGRPGNSGIYKNYIIYIETKADTLLPKFETAWIEGKGYFIKPIEVKNELRLGKTKDDKEVVMNAGNGKKLWQLVLSPNAPVLPDSSLTEKMKKDPIVLTGEWKNKPFEYSIKKVQELETSFGQ